jgi:dephospho-CoA kinase
MIAAQMPAELKRARSDHVIDNTGTLAELAARVDEVWQEISAPTPPARDPRPLAEAGPR